MGSPDISVIMPIFDTQLFLEDTIRSLREQSFQNFEVIFVIDNFENESYKLLQKTAEYDCRFRILQQAHTSAGIAKNLGLTAARGQYVLFQESGDLFHTQLLEQLYIAAQENRADVAACNFSRFGSNGKDIRQTGIYPNWLPADTVVFSYKDCPDYILRITGPFVCNKLYRTSFLRKNQIQFDSFIFSPDISFIAVSMACADRIVLVSEALVRLRIKQTSSHVDFQEVQNAVNTTIFRLSALPHNVVIKNAISRFVVETYISTLKKNITDFADNESKLFYEYVHELFCSDTFLNLKIEQLHNNDLYWEFCTVQKHSYSTMRDMVSKRLIVSLTSFPRRISTVSQVLKTIYAQTKQPDEIVLWLAREQFPNKETDLPEDLLQLVQQKRLTVCWCNDLKSHKKYFYAFQKFPNDLVVTIDDDLLYPPDMLSLLYASYLLHPEAVSTVRSHLMVLSKTDEPLPYIRWSHESNFLLHAPSMQLVATSGAGTLHSPKLYRKEFFDWESIKSNSLYADDLWQKAMALFSDVPVVQACPHRPLQFLPNTQDDSLFTINSLQGENDNQLKRIIQWTNTTFGPNTFIQKITQPVCGELYMDIEAVAWRTEQARRAALHASTKKQHELNLCSAKLAQSLENNTQLKDTLINTQNTLVQLRDELSQSEEKSDKLKKELIVSFEELESLRVQLQLLAESKPIGRQLQDIRISLQKEEQNSLLLCVKLVVYYLAWIPEFLLEGMMYFLKNGAKQTLKQIYRKLFRRKK